MKSIWTGLLLVTLTNSVATAQPPKDIRVKRVGKGFLVIKGGDQRHIVNYLNDPTTPIARIEEHKKYGFVKTWFKDGHREETYEPSFANHLAGGNVALREKIDRLISWQGVDFIRYAMERKLTPHRLEKLFDRYGVNDAAIFKAVKDGGASVQ